jgi:hypothetical protein
MKKIITLLFVVLIFSAVTVNAQRRSPMPKSQTEISFLGGYLFSGSYDGARGNVDIKDEPTYGATISYRPARTSTMTIELEYLGSPGKVVLTPFASSIDSLESLDVSVNYFLIGVGYGSMASPTTQLFSMFKLGLLYAIPASSSRYESTTNFAVSLAGGGKFFLSKSFGIRLQAGLYFPVRFSEGGVYVGTGGVDYGVGTTSSLVQFNLSGGIMFMF